MYQVTSAFLEQMKSPIQEHKITGTIGSVSFDEANIVEGSFSISNQSTDTNDVVLGSCYVGQLTAEFIGINIAYGKWINKTITLSFGLKVGEYYEYVPLGVYKVKEAKHTDHGVQVTAYDNMIKFDKKFRKSHYMNLSGMTNIIDQLCLDAGVVCGMTHAQIEELPNGDRTGINIYGSTGKKAEFANDITTLRDLLFWVAQTLGCFATINRAGQLEFRPYNQNVVDQITEQHRIAGATFADYITHYVGIYVENLDDNTEDYYGYDATALQQELTETMAEITEDQEDITDLELDRADWVQKLANHECTQQEYDAAIAEIDAQEKALTKEIKQLTKRAEWLSNAIAQSADDGSDMVLGANPLTMAKNLTTRDSQRREILGALNAISYTPFQASVVCGCIYDLGDVIQFSGGLYNSDTDSFGCVMSYTYTHNGGTELEGFGVDPSVVVIRNKTQKSVDRADRNAHESTRAIVGEGNPNPDDPDNPVTGKEGDLYIQENHPTKKLQITKTFKGFQTYHICRNNLTYYTLDTFHLSCNSGNFVTVFIPGSVRYQGQDLTYCVINSQSRKFGTVYFVLKLPKNATIPEFTADISDLEEHNFPPPRPFQDVHLKGWGKPGETVTPFTFNGTSDGWRQLNDAGTYYYYFGIVGGAGTWIGGMLDEPTYTFENMTAFQNAMKADEIVIPDVYEGQESKQIKYNDGSGGSSQWKGISTVSNVSTSDEAGGTENNGLALSQSILSLKPNVVRAWYKADPPQTKRTFSQLCVRYTGSPDKQVVIEPYANHEWANSGVDKDDDGVYKIKCHGTYNSGSLCYVVYKLTGLVQDKEYFFNFRCKFASNATFNYDMSKGLGLVFSALDTLSSDNFSGDEDTFNESTLYYAFKRNTNPWYGDFGFTAVATTMYMHVLMQCETTAADVTFTMSEFVVSQKERELIRNIYLYDYHVNEWLKYKPFTGTVSGGDEGGSTVAIQPTLSQGTKIANFSIDGIPGELYAPNNQYELPIASADTLGGIKVGANLSIDEETGVLSASAAPSDIEDLSDVNVDEETLTDGQVLKWDDTEEEWVNADESGGSQAIELTKAQYDALPSTEKNDPNKVYYVKDYPTPSGIDLDDIDDVDITTPTDGQVLKYDAANSKWVNGADEGGLFSVVDGMVCITYETT